MVLPPPNFGDNMARQKEEDDETASEGVLNAFLPGIGKLMSNLKGNSQAIKQRLEETDKEIERRIAAGGSRRPVIDYNVRVRTLVPENDTTTSFKPFVKKGEQESYSSKPKPRDADVFDEGDKIVIVVELQGVKKVDINIKTSEDAIEISTQEYYKKITLPCEVSGEPGIRFKNGILELRFAKKGRQ